MNITRIGLDKIVSYSPYREGQYTVREVAYEKADGTRLTVDTFFKEGKKVRIEKVLTRLGENLKRKVKLL